MKRVVLLLLSLSVIGLMAGCKKEEGSIKVGAILSVTGPSFLGVPESRTAQMLVDEMNANGGWLNRKIELIVKDDGGSPEKALSFAKQLIEEDKVLAIIGPSTSGSSMQIKQVCEETETLLISCAAAEAIVDPVAKWVFKTPQSDAHAAQAIFQTMKDLGIKRVGVVAANTGFGNGGMAQLEKYAPQFGIDLAIKEQYDKAATDLSALMTKVNAQNVDAVINWSIVDAQSIIPKNMRQLGMKQVLFQSHGFGNIKYVEVAGEAAEGIIFPAGRLLVADVLPDGDPQKKVLLDYKTAYEEKFDEEASTFGGHAWDAMTILATAVKKAGSTDKYKVRDAVEGLKGLVGTGGVFTFSATNHNGLDLSAFRMITVKNGQFVPYE